MRTFLAVPMAREIVNEKTGAIPKLILLVDAVERDDLAAADKLLAGFPDGGFAGFIKPLIASWVTSKSVTQPLEALSP